MEHIAIIGNGISGVTAARHIRKRSDARITLISSEHPYFFSRTALMYVYMGHMKFEHTEPYERQFWYDNRIQRYFGHVSAVHPQNKTLQMEDGRLLTYDKLIIATGSKPNRFGWPGQDLPGVQGLYSKQDLEALEQHAPNNKVCRRAVIVGGGLIGVELAEMLRSRHIPVTFLVRESSFWNGVLPDADSALINDHIRDHGVDLRLGMNLESITADANGRGNGVIVKETGEHITCDLVGLTAGVSPNIDFLKGSEIETRRGVLVNRYLETTVPDVYAIGDCAEHTQPAGLRRPVEAVWYTGRMMGETVAQSICGDRTAYKPGHWFNSAKFFDIEYQTYGWVFPKPLEGHVHFHWKHPSKGLCMTFEYERDTERFKGINTFGIRLRHEVFDRWLNEGKTIGHVIAELKTANFDPEFYTHYEKSIQRAFAAHHSAATI